jgi:hypothetical protein
MKIQPRLRDLTARLLRGRGSRARYGLELERPILIRQSAARRRACPCAARSPRQQEAADGAFLLAEIDGELVAAVPLDADAEPVKDPFRATANIRELLGLQAGHGRRHRDTHAWAKSRRPRE